MSVESLFSAPATVVERPEKSLATAFVLSLLLPGAGHIYCGKTSTGVWTMFWFLTGFLVTTLLAVSRVPQLAIVPALIWAVPIYIFAFLDAVLTTREANEGRDLPAHGNPRIAAILNLLTTGLGYFYLGERKLGLIVFLAGRIVGTSVPFPLSILLQIGFAVHAYVKCRHLYPDEPLRSSTVAG
jgi:hypothetical protein